MLLIYKKSLSQAAFSKNPVISFSVLRAKSSVLNQPESWMRTLAFFCLFVPLCMYEQELSCSFFVMPIVRLEHILSSVQTLIEACQ